MLPYNYDTENEDTGCVLPPLLCLCGDTRCLRPLSFMDLKDTASLLLWMLLVLCAETPYGQLPYMVYKGKVYGQSNAIAAFFAKQFG